MRFPTVKTFYFPFILVQLITYQFLHGDLWHIFINMLILWLFGRELEGFLGSRRFLVLYLLSGIAGGLLHILWSIILGGAALPLVGASGSLFGLLVFYAFMWPNRQILMFPIMVPIKAKISSRGHVERLIIQAIRGLPIRHLPNPPGEIPIQPGRCYFAVDQSGDHWTAISESRSIAVYVPPEFTNLQIELMAVRE